MFQYPGLQERQHKFPWQTYYQPARYSWKSASTTASPTITHTHTNNLHTHAFHKTLSVREFFWETSLRPQANTTSIPCYAKLQSPSLTGLLIQSTKLSIFGPHI